MCEHLVLLTLTWKDVLCKVPLTVEKILLFIIKYSKDLMDFVRRR